MIDVKVVYPLKIVYILKAGIGTNIKDVASLAIDKFLHYNADEVNFEFNDYEYIIKRKKVTK